MERINRRGKIRLEPVKVIAAVMSAARDLDVFHQLSYVLELARQLGRLSELGTDTFELICEYLAFLEDQAQMSFDLSRGSSLCSAVSGCR